jgi:hypothetical protein
MLVRNLFEELNFFKKTDLLVNKVKIKNMHWLNDEIVQKDF